MRSAALALALFVLFASASTDAGAGPWHSRPLNVVDLKPWGQVSASDFARLGITFQRVEKTLSHYASLLRFDLDLADASLLRARGLVYPIIIARSEAARNAYFFFVPEDLNTPGKQEKAFRCGVDKSGVTFFDDQGGIRIDLADSCVRSTNPSTKHRGHWKYVQSCVESNWWGLKNWVRTVCAGSCGACLDGEIGICPICVACLGAQVASCADLSR